MGPECPHGGWKRGGQRRHWAGALVRQRAPGKWGRRRVGGLIPGQGLVTSQLWAMGPGQEPTPSRAWGVPPVPEQGLPSSAPSCLGKGMNSWPRAA